MNSNHVSYLEDDWENFNRGAQNRSNLFNKQVQILDYSNRNLKFKNDSLASEPSYKEINYRKTMNKPQKNTMPNFTFMDQINEISHFSSRFHKGDHPFFQSSRLPFGGIKTTSKEIWKKGFFKILVLIFRFKSNLKRKTFKYILRSLKPNQLEMIGDNAFFLESYQNISKVLWEKKLEKLALDKSKNIGLRSRLSNRTSLKKIESKKDKFKSFCLKMAKILVISVAYFLKLISYLKPNLKTRIFWDITLIIILLTQMWYIPVFSSFEIALEAPGLRIYFQTIPLIIFSIDIFFNFVTGYYSKGLWVTEKRRIARHYLKKEFWIDIFTLVPLFLSYLNVATNQWAFCFMLRVVRISKMVRKIEDHFQLQVNYSSILSLGKLATTLIFIVHVFACMWNLLARIEVFFNSNSHTWLAEKEIDNENWVIKYMAAFYYTLVTSVTVGYGDIVPQNSVERLFSCLIILFGCGQNAYSINSIGSIFQDMFREETALK